jgi:hypothetical protein
LWPNERRWPIGTKERVWLDVLLYTGLRRGDAVIIGRQHVRDGVATLRTEKSQREMIVTLPILPVLQRTARCRADWRTCFHLRQEGQAADQGIVRNAARVAAILRQRAARRWRNSKRSSAGRAGGWPHFTPRPQTESNLRSTPCTRWRTKRENLCPHPKGRWERQSEKQNENNGKKFKWWGRQDSNLRRHSQRIYSPRFCFKSPYCKGLS